MFDLNLSSPETSPASSGTSSVLSTCAASAADSFRFGILRGGGAHRGGFETAQLFPVPDTKALESESSTVLPAQQQPKKSRRGPRSRSSQYRGVTFYRRTGRWESHIWDCGKQVYLGGFDTAHAAARAYDRAAIKFRGVEADINFVLGDYDEDMKQMGNLSKEEFVHILRRQSNGFSRGSSKYKGATLHKCGRWEARMGQLLGKKAYDMAAIRFSGGDAVTNFIPGTYEGELHPQVENDVISHDLDLNLRISQPNISNPKRIDNPIGIQYHFGSIGASKGAKIDSSILSSQPHGFSTTAEHSQLRTALYPAFFLRNEESSAGKRPELCLPTHPNWAWQTQNSSAASSGFATNTTLPGIRPSQPPSSLHLSFLPPHSRS